MRNSSLRDQLSQFPLYTAPGGGIKVEVLISGETIRLTRKRMAKLFGVGVSANTRLLRNVFESIELQHESTVSILEIVRNDAGREVVVSKMEQTTIVMDNLFLDIDSNAGRHASSFLQIGEAAE